MALDPEIAALIEARAALGRPPFPKAGVAAARGFIAADMALRPKGKPVDHVENRTIPGPAGDIPVRIYRPTGETGLPVVVFAHGGGFVICDLDTHDNLCRNIAADTGAVVVSVDYRLGPEHRFPAAPDDCFAALRWVADNAASIGGDAARIVVAGDSAGGNLAAVMALRARDLGGPALAGQLLIYPVTAPPDAGFASYADFAEGYGLTAADMVWFFDNYVTSAEDARHPDCSPLHAADLAGLPPTFLVTVQYDVLRDEGLAYARRLAEAGNAISTLHHPTLNHGCIGLYGQITRVAEIHDEMIHWLKRVTAA